MLFNHDVNIIIFNCVLLFVPYMMTINNFFFGGGVLIGVFADLIDDGLIGASCRLLCTMGQDLFTFTLDIPGNGF